MYRLPYARGLERTGMADKARFEPESFQIVSDLGQMRLFANPMKMRILRILQHQEATVDQLAAMVEEPDESIARHIGELVDRRLVRLIDRQVRDGQIRDLYRATALIYQLRPDPADVSFALVERPYEEAALRVADETAPEPEPR